MSRHRPAEPPSYTNRATGALARSPSEQLEPTRPLARSRSRPRRRVYNADPGRSWGLFRLVSGVFTILLLVMAILGCVALVLQNWVSAPGPLATGKSVVIPKGEGVIEIAARLEREGVITDRRLFMAGYYIAKAIGWGESGRSLQLKAGDYQIPQAASIRNVIDILAEGKTASHRVTIPEGLTSHQIVERLKADPNLTGDVTEVPPEGSLLPETFVLQRGAQRQAVLDNMRAESKKLMERMWAQRQRGLPIRTWEEAVVLASIVEKETGRNDERERVAAVFMNRLRQNMRLQSDPTILYGLTAGKTVWNRPIMKSEILQKTAHNTYQIDGLPPTPICNPGRASIEAVLNPASTKDLYFVADGNGGHMFSETLKDHNASVQKWRALEKEVRESKEKEAKEKEAKDRAAAAGSAAPAPTPLPTGADKESKAKTAAPGPAPAAAPDKQGKAKAAAPAAAATPGRAPDKSNPGKTPDKANNGTATPASPATVKPAPQRQEGSWASTADPVQPKTNLP
jgi:UPF0755 protein